MFFLMLTRWDSIALEASGRLWVFGTRSAAISSWSLSEKWGEVRRNRPKNLQNSENIPNFAAQEENLPKARL